MGNNFTVTITDNRIQEFLIKIPNIVDAIVQKTALDLEADAKESLTGARTGITYTRKGRSHQASAPGEPPATDFGSLSNSIEAKKTGLGSAEVTVGETEIGPALEWGSIKRHIAPRPFMRPAAERARKPFTEAFDQLEEKLK